MDSGIGLDIVDATEDDPVLTVEGCIVSNMERRTSRRSAFCIEHVVLSILMADLALFHRL